VRPDEDPRALARGPSCCVGLAGGSPAAVSVAAPRSRPRAWGEILPPERGVKSPQEAVWPLGGEQACGPNAKSVNLAAPRQKNPKGEVAEPIMSRRRQQTAPARSEGVQDASGVWRRARRDSRTRNRRDPPRRPTSGEGGPYKPMAKGGRAGRESEGLVVPSTAGGQARPREGALL
jgi:hypothetical protein